MPHDPTTTRNVWARLSDETAAAYHAFSKYRDFGYQRSLLKAWRKLKAIRDDAAAEVPSHWNRWSTKHDWVRRADAFDEHQDAIEQHERDKRATKLAALKADFEFERQTAKEKRIRDMDLVLDKYQSEAALSIRDMSQQKTETVLVNGKPKTTVTVTKFKAIKGGDYGKVAKVQAELEELAGPGKATKVELTGKGGGPLTIAILDDILRDPDGKKEEDQ